jgi:4-hydroxybenzoate polyprenyltransferase/phosphoserine phosphatase
MTMNPPINAATVLTLAPAPTLVVDLDGTLTPTDTLVESYCAAVRQRPLLLLTAPWHLLRGRAAFKQHVASNVVFDAAGLPLREDLIDYLLQAKRDGRRIVLATAADSRIAEAVAARVGLFDAVLASDGARNLKGSAKLAVILDQVGPDFAYAGDSRADLPVWRAASAAVLVDVPARIAQQVRQSTPVEHEFRRAAPTLAVWARALRVHQWLKNLLIFLPLLTSFSFGDPAKLLSAAIAFMAFSLMASATYMANDIADLESDRRHPRKRTRAFASGLLSIQQGIPVALALLLGSAALASVVSPAFLGMLLVYLVITTSYSWVLKRYVLIDVLTLALLYTLRVLAGAVAISVTVTPWLLAFSMFVFLSLALVKRCAELVSFQRSGIAGSSGRDYQVTDLVILWPLGVGAGLCSIVVFGLFVAATTENSRYATANLLWCVGVGLTYWIGRLWIKTVRGEMTDDPIVFTLRDRGSRIVIAAMVLTTLAAQFLRP